MGVCSDRLGGALSFRLVTDRPGPLERPLKCLEQIVDALIVRESPHVDQMDCTLMRRLPNLADGADGRASIFSLVVAEVERHSTAAHDPHLVSERLAPHPSERDAEDA